MRVSERVNIVLFPFSVTEWWLQWMVYRPSPLKEPEYIKTEREIERERERGREGRNQNTERHRERGREGEREKERKRESFFVSKRKGEHRALSLLGDRVVAPVDGIHSYHQP